MKKPRQNFDLLLNEHTNRQLAAVDWDQLQARIRNRLDKRAPSASVKPKPVRWAVGIASAAAALFIVLILMDDRKQPLTVPAGQQAAVKLTESRTVVRTQIETPAASVTLNLSPVHSVVRIGPSDTGKAQCAVTIIDRNGHTEKESDARPSWIIITASEPTQTENRNGTEQWDIACLL